MGQPGDLGRQKPPTGFVDRVPVVVWGRSRVQTFMWTLQEHNKKYETNKFQFTLASVFFKIYPRRQGTCPHAPSSLTINMFTVCQIYVRMHALN